LKTSFTSLPGAASLSLRPIESLTVYDRNARKHSAKQIEKLAASIREFGFNAPVLVDGNGVILAGHGRIEAARKLGLKQVRSFRSRISMTPGGAPTSWRTIGSPTRRRGTMIFWLRSWRRSRPTASTSS
jgi:ParB-like nuclease domain